MQQLLRLLESQEYQHGCYKKNHFHSKDEVTGLKSKNDLKILKNSILTQFLNQNSLSDDIPHIVNVETGYIHADENAEGHLSKLKNEKAYVKYYFPTEKFVPLDELPIVCKFLVKQGSIY